jgi:hypothetical protein
MELHLGVEILNFFEDLLNLVLLAHELAVFLVKVEDVPDTCLVKLRLVHVPEVTDDERDVALLILVFE